MTNAELAYSQHTLYIIFHPHHLIFTYFPSLFPVGEAVDAKNSPSLKMQVILCRGKLLFLNKAKSVFLSFFYPQLEAQGAGLIWI